MGADGVKGHVGARGPVGDSGAPGDIGVTTYIEVPGDPADPGPTGQSLNDP